MNRALVLREVLHNTGPGICGPWLWSISSARTGWVSWVPWFITLFQNMKMNSCPHNPKCQRNEGDRVTGLRGVGRGVVHAHVHMFPVRTNTGIRGNWETLLREYWRERWREMYASPMLQISLLKRQQNVNTLPKYCLTRGGYYEMHFSYTFPQLPISCLTVTVMVFSENKEDTGVVEYLAFP